MKTRILALIVACLAPLCAHAGASSPSPTPIEIPLIHYSDSSQLGINVLIGTDPIPHPYLLDTGSIYFATAMNVSAPSWQGADFTNTGNTFHISLAGGNLVYDGNVATATLTIPTTGSNLVLPNATMGIITNATLNHAPYPNWDADISADPAIPPENPNTNRFFGTLGAGLFNDAGSGNVSSVLGQIPTPGLKQGFVIQTGGINSTTPTLTVGLTAAMIQSFPIIIQMNSKTGNITTSTGVNVNLYPENQINASYSFTNGNGTPYTYSGNMVIDSGGLGTHIQISDTLPDDIGNTTDGIRDGVTFSAAAPGFNGNQSLDWTFLAGETDYVNKIAVDAGSGTINSGIALYYQYDVMFDTTDGLVGLRPMTVPEPSSVALIIGGVCFVLATAWKMKRQMKRREEATPSKGSKPRSARR